MLCVDPCGHHPSKIGDFIPTGISVSFHRCPLAAPQRALVPRKVPRKAQRPQPSSSLPRTGTTYYTFPSYFIADEAVIVRREYLRWSNMTNAPAPFSTRTPWIQRVHAADSAFEPRHILMHVTTYPGSRTQGFRGGGEAWDHPPQSWPEFMNAGEDSKVPRTAVRTDRNHLNTLCIGPQEQPCRRSWFECLELCKRRSRLLGCCETVECEVSSSTCRLSIHDCNFKHHVVRELWMRKTSGSTFRVWSLAVGQVLSNAGREG